MMTVNYLPAIVTGIVVALVVVLPIVRYRLRYGSSPIGSIGQTRWVLRVFAIFLLVQSLRFSGSTSAARPQVLMRPQPVVALILIFLGLIVTTRAQWEMGASWRIGIDRHAKPGLITGGLYRFSRNPIYSGLGLIIIGYILAMPTLAAVILFVIGSIAGIFVVRREERYLVATYGDEYLAYASRVGRFDPWLGRLS